MVQTLKIEVRPEEIIEAIKGMEKKRREAFLEDLIAATSPEYLDSVREARADYKVRRVRTHEEVFGKSNMNLSIRGGPKRILKNWNPGSKTG
jgi:hypothetical protein